MIRYSIGQTHNTPCLDIIAVQEQAGCGTPAGGELVRGWMIRAEAIVHQLAEVGVLQGRRDPLLVVQLFVYCQSSVLIRTYQTKVPLFKHNYAIQLPFLFCRVQQVQSKMN